jgi:5-amino-6-(5-phospho-D-ribitylamino)uracil phosphatase
VSSLYISDLDGTLLRNDQSLSDFTRSRLAGLLEDGLPFSVASARSVASIRPLLSGLPLRLPVVELNGAYISDLATGRHDVVNAIDRDVAAALCAGVAAAGLSPIVSTFDGEQDQLHRGRVINEGMGWWEDDRLSRRDPRFDRTLTLEQAVKQQVVCITVIDRRERLEELAASLDELAASYTERHLFENAYSPGWHWLTYHDARATKANGVRTLMELTGHDAHDLIVFGDEMNDVSLFEIACEGVVVANGCDALKGVATHCIGSNEEDSVVRYIEEHWGMRRAGEEPRGPAAARERRG